MYTPGQFLRLLRLRRGLTVQQLAIELAVYHYCFFEELEKGTAPIPQALYPALAKVLQVTLEDFETLMMAGL
jgi:transcriptional regulator with XRE-family HTH domain